MPTRDEVAGLPSDLQEFFSALAERYAIEHELGRGGHAIVFRAQDLKLKRAVAIKVLRPELSLQVRAERFLREIEIIAGLQHPHIVSLFDSGTAAGRLFYVMPFVEGETLETLLERDGTLPIDEAMRYTGEIAEALSHAHSRGIVHRDIKPGNILLSGGHALVADFGIARALGVAAGSSISTDGVVVGTPEYMSPEQAGAKHVDARSDQYSLACVTYAMLAGQPPFTGPSAQVIIARHLGEPPPPLRVARPAVSVPLQGVVERALAKTPADRWATVEEFAGAARRGAAAATVRPGRLPRGRTAIGVLAVAAVVFAIWRIGFPTEPRLDSNAIVVFPLLQTPPTAFEEGAGLQIASALGSALEHTEPLRWIDGWTWLEPAERRDAMLLTAPRARDIARARHARWYIEGTLSRHGDFVTVVLRLIDVATDSVAARVTDAGHASQIAQAGWRALNKLLTRLLAPGRTSDLSVLTDRDPGAVAIWLQGEREYRHSRFASALQLYGRAVAADSALAVAALKGAWAAHWQHDQAEALRFVNVARNRRGYLPARYLAFADALRHYLIGAADSAAEGFRHAVAAERGWVEGWAGLGETYYHLLPSDGGLEAMAETAFVQALAADPGFAPALFHLTQIALRRADVTRAESLFVAFRTGSPDSTWLAQLRIELACVRDGPAAINWVATAAAHPGSLMRGGKDLSSVAAHAGCAERAFEAVLRSRTATLEDRWGAVAGLQTLRVTRGRLAETRALLDTALQSGIASTAGLYILDALAGFSVDDGEAQRVIDQFGVKLEVMSTVALWYRGRWMYHSKNIDEFRTICRVLDERARASGDRVDRLRADVLAAYLALARGDTTEAIGDFRALVPVGAGPELAWGFWEALAAERLTLAELLLARGDFAEVLRVTRFFDHPQPLTFRLYERRSLEVRAAAAESLGQGEAARAWRARLAAS
jgi:tRNA A-37 threonylcarbamoyl transferase component Bud32